ncbi:MAG: hypothetical protein HQL33_09325, partial [Alphaproteobacteria bacterium]|nr:hypothetical protein [Alphaproteobacteria bacterium]
MRFGMWMRMLTAGAVVAGFAVASAASAVADDEASIVRGGRLYDKWWAENKAEKPVGTH